MHFTLQILIRIHSPLSFTPPRPIISLILLIISIIHLRSQPTALLISTISSRTLLRLLGSSRFHLRFLLHLPSYRYALPHPSKEQICLLGAGLGFYL